MVFLTQKTNAAREVSLEGVRNEWPPGELSGWMKGNSLEEPEKVGGAFVGTAVIFAGLPEIPKGRTYKELLDGKVEKIVEWCNQPWHADMMGVEVPGSGQVSVSKNPRLKNMCPGYSWLAPVDDFRELMFRDEHGVAVKLRVNAGEVAVWGGDVYHCGAGISEEDLRHRESLHPALHGYYENFGHPWNLDDVELDVDAVRGDGVEDVGRLDEGQTNKQFEKLTTTAKSFMRGVFSRSGKKERAFRVLVEDFSDEVREELARSLPRSGKQCKGEVARKQVLKVQKDEMMRWLAKEDAMWIDRDDGEEEICEAEEELAEMLEDVQKEIEKRKSGREKESRKRDREAEKAKHNESEDSDDGGGKPAAKKRKKVN